MTDDDILNAPVTISTTKSLLKNLEECQGAEEGGIIEWLAVDKRDQGYRQEREDDIMNWQLVVERMAQMTKSAKMKLQKLRKLCTAKMVLL